MIGNGTVHHIAFSTSSYANQRIIMESIIKKAYPTPLIDKTYFLSVYFREPGGILFEIVTDPPGFIIDQKVEDLGKNLVLQSWLEPVRENLEKVLPKIELYKNNSDNLIISDQ